MPNDRHTPKRLCKKLLGDNGFARACYPSFHLLPLGLMALAMAKIVRQYDT